MIGADAVHRSGRVPLVAFAVVLGSRAFALLVAAVAVNDPLLIRSALSSRVAISRPRHDRMPFRGRGGQDIAHRSTELSQVRAKGVMELMALLEHGLRHLVGPGFALDHEQPPEESATSMSRPSRSCGRSAICNRRTS